MLSLDPLMGPAGYPLLLQTGETANGVTPLIDRQHPHDLFMELAGVYSQPPHHELVRPSLCRLSRREPGSWADDVSCTASPAWTTPPRRSRTTGTTPRTSPLA